MAVVIKKIVINKNICFARRSHSLGWRSFDMCPWEIGYLTLTHLILSLYLLGLPTTKHEHAKWRRRAKSKKMGLSPSHWALYHMDT